MADVRLVPSASGGSVVVAAFDVDKTLTTRDCVVPFLRRVGGRGWYASLAVRIPQLLIATIRRRRDRLKEIATAAAVRGRDAGRVDAEAARFAERVVESWMRSDTWARLRWHAAQGHRVVLVSASYRNYLAPLADRLGAESVLSTEIEVGPDGRCTGRLVGSNCRGEEKSRRLRAWLTERRLDDAVIWAYGDSAGDDHLLAMAHVSTRVGRAPIPERPDTMAA